MQVASVSARQARTHYRHELRTLTYVTLDEANGGIIRNLNHEGVAVQAVAPLRLQQRVRLRFELRFPRLRVEAYGLVSWANPSGQCGVRFIDLPARTTHQINEWIFSNLLDAVSRDAAHSQSVLGASVVSIGHEKNVSAEDDGLTLSPSARPAIRMDAGGARQVGERMLREDREEILADLDCDPRARLGWLSRPISGPTLAWLVDSLVVLAGLLLFALIFLSIAHELPPWSLALGAAAGAAVFVAAAYWSLFALFGGASLGAQLAQVASGFEEGEEVEEAVACGQSGAGLMG